MTYSYAYPRPMVTTDIIVYKKFENVWYFLLIKRRNDPFMDFWALPGGFVDENEGLETAAMRELQEETGIYAVNLKQFKSYGNPNRDPRGHTVSVVFSVNFEGTNNQVMAGDDAKDAQWFKIDALPQLAFDHETILSEYIANFPSH